MPWLIFLRFQDKIYTNLILETYGMLLQQMGWKKHLLSNLSWQVPLLEGDEQIAETRAVPYGVRPSPSLADPALRDAQDVLDIMAKVALFMKSMKSLRSSFERSWLTSLKILIGNLYK